MKKNSIISFVILAIIIAIAYWQISFLRHVLLWDTPNASYPFRFYSTECYRNGHLPLWLPYQFTGYPFYADPQSGCWYPITWILSLIGRYTLVFSNLEYIFCIFIGGIGMYRLTEVWTKDKSAALFAGLSYACCGVFVSNAEHLTIIVSSGWLPWLFWAYYQLVHRLEIKYVGFFAIFLFFILTGGYPAFIIICFYIFILIFISLFFNGKFKTKIKRLLWLHVILVILCIGCSSIVLYSFANGILESTRNAGVSLDLALTLPFSPVCFTSLLLPFASIKNIIFYKTDISMSNGYFGLIGFIFFIMSFFQKKDGKFWLILLLSILCMLAAVGSALPFRALLYKWVPFMNLFSYPSIFRVFFITGFLLLSATAFMNFKNNWVTQTKNLIIVIVLIFTFYFVVLLYSLNNSEISNIDWHSLITRRFNFIEHSTFAQHLIIQSFIQILFLIIIIIIALNRKQKLKFLLVICVVDLIVSVQLNMYGTIANRLFLKDAKARIDMCPKGFPLPDNRIPSYLYIDADFGAELDPVGRNTLMFKKVLGIDGYNPFVLKRFDRFKKSKIWDSAWRNSPAYFANSIVLINDSIILDRKNDVCVNDTDLKTLQSKFFPQELGDSIFFVAFGPNNMTLQTRSSGARLLILQQNNVKDWNVTVDDKKTKWYSVNIAYMGVLVPTGIHKVDFQFRPSNLYIFLIFSLISGLTCILMIFSPVLKLVTTKIKRE